MTNITRLVKLIENEEDYKSAIDRIEVLMDDDSQGLGGELDILTYMVDVYERQAVVAYDFVLEIIKMHEDSILLKKAHEPDAGYDIHAYLKAPLEILPGQNVNIPSGIRIMIPRGWMGIIENRSGLSTKHGLAKLAGVIDSFYEGELMVCILNTSNIS